MQTFLFYKNASQVLFYIRFSKNLLKGDMKFKPWIYDWFDDPFPAAYSHTDNCILICVSNWDQVKDRLPIFYHPTHVLDDW